jgi:phosphopantetheinyl transferase
LPESAPTLVVRWRTGAFGADGLPARADADSWLSPPERMQLAAFTVAKRREDWLLGRVNLKALVCAVLAERWAAKVGPSAIRVCKEPSGAPTAWLEEGGMRESGGRTPLPLAVSSSHSGGRAMAATAWADGPRRGSWSAAIGADLERVEPRSPRLVADFFTRRERQQWLAAPGRMRSAVANLTWSAKEAVLKLLACGLRADTRWLTCLLDETAGRAGEPGLDLRHVVADGPDPDDGSWRRYSVDVDPRLADDTRWLAGRCRLDKGYAMALAVGMRSGRSP